MKIPKQGGVKTLVQGLQAALMKLTQTSRSWDPLKRWTLMARNGFLLVVVLNSRHSGSAFKGIKRLRANQIRTHYSKTFSSEQQLGVLASILSSSTVIHELFPSVSCG